MGLPQYIFIAITLISLGMAIAEHDEPRKNTNAWASIIGTAITMWLLGWGGFFG